MKSSGSRRGVRQPQNDSGYMRLFRTMLFQRIVPIVHDIGLWSDEDPGRLWEMGVLNFADTDYSALMADDNRRAEEFDEEARLARTAYVKSVADFGAAGVAAE